jgi:DNA-binding CsgD family transcriptional regulator
MERGAQVVLGREHELDALERFVGTVPGGPSGVLLEGSAGIGKTTLWLEAAAMAGRAGWRILSTRASEAETGWSYAGLGDLLAGLVDEPIDDLPDPQWRALEMALLRTESSGAPLDQRAVSLATLAVVRAIAGRSPVLIAIDDVQWLDPSTARVVSFVLRRLTDELVAVLGTQRIGSGAPEEPMDLHRAVPSLVRIPVGPMQEDPIASLLRERVGAELSHPLLSKVHTASNGNPMFALEIARAVARTGLRADAADPLPVPDDLQHLLSTRLASLPPAADRVLLIVAASSYATTDLVLRASPTPAEAETGLATAEIAGVIERADGRIRFSHPLYASTVYVNASERDRRQVHQRLATLVDDPEERARHLALAADRPDAAVARALDEAARVARGRGAPDAAADLAELARRATPPDDRADARRRSLEVAEYHFDAGDAARALEVLKDAIDAEPPGPTRAEMLFRLSAMSWMNLIDGVRSPAERALAEAGEDHDVRSGIEVSLAWVAFYLGDLASATSHAQRAMDEAERTDSAGVRADALATSGFVEFVSGVQATDRMVEAIALQDRMMAQGSWTEASVYTTPRSILGLELMWSGRLDEARQLFEEELAGYERHAMYTVRQEVLCYLAELECRAGRWSLASELAADAMDTVLESGQTATQSHVALFNRALPAAHLGHVDEARTWASEGERLAVANDDAFNASWNRAVLGFLELSVGDAERAIAHLEPVVAYLERMGSVEPAIIPSMPDAIEALVALGSHDEAERLVDGLEKAGRSRDRPWAIATSLRGRALIEAARGNSEEGAMWAERALEEHARVPLPFETARTEFVLGQIQRRRKQKRAARSALERARETFVRLGAPLWAERTEAELARIGGRPPAPLELTSTERSVAGLVGEGRTNREVADALFMSPSTVQAHLKHIYRKLGIRSRTELAAGLDRSRRSR